MPVGPVDRFPWQDNPQIRAEGWRWHARAETAALLAAGCGCAPEDLHPTPVRLVVPPGDGFFCFGNPWETVALYRWFGMREGPTSVPPFALQRLWCREPDEGGERFLYHSFLPRVQARLLRSSQHAPAPSPR